MSHLHHDQVAEFHRAFGHPIHDLPTAPSPELIAQRRKWTLEEHVELHDAIRDGDRPGQADAYADLAYFAHGTLWACGLPYDPANRFDHLTLDDAVRAHLRADTLARLHYTALAVCAHTRSEAAWFGIPFDAVFAAVHAANMDKLDPVTGKPVILPDGKIGKREGWQPPDIAAVLAAHGGDQ